jgi:hypothetical protein
MNDICAEILSEVLFAPEGFYVSGADGTRHYIQSGGTDVRSFLPGWAPLFLYSGLSGLYLLELRHETGHHATWFLDKRFARLSDSVRDLQPPYDEILRAAARTLRADIWTQLMLAPVPALQQATRGFFQINESTRAQVLAAGEEPGASDAVVVNISTHAEPTLRCEWAGGEAVLQQAFLKAIVQAPIKDRFIDACITGTLTWPSPIDGAPMRLLGGLFLDDFRFAYRMLDERAGLVVVVVATEHHNRTIAVFLPQVGIIVVAVHRDADLLEAHFGRLVPALEHHLWDHALVLERYFGSENFTFASVLRGQPHTHLGHQLWNELSPIEDVVRAVPPDRRPLFLVPNAAEGTEIYGPLDVLFPELAGRVLRFNGGVWTIVPEAYARHLCVTRITDERVPASLRSRILALANASSAGREARAAAEAISASGLPIVLIGLRVENRTLVDLPRFLIALIERMVARIGPAVFVIDGHNRRFEAKPDAMLGSHWEHAAASRPLDVERQTVSQLEAHFAGTRARIVSTVGASIYSSLVWSSHSKIFFAIWGAGLAKYRWVANIPGFVVSSAWNLLHRYDLHIYDDPQYMEDPTQLLFANPTCVSDQVDQRPLVVPGGTLHPSYANFDVSIEALWPQIEAFLESLKE